MIKRIIQALLIIGGLAVIGYVYYKFSGEEKSFVDSLDAVPGNVIFMMEISSFEKIDDYNELLNAMANHSNEISGVSFNPVVEWPAIVSGLDSLQLHVQDWHDALSSNSIYFCSTEQFNGHAWLLSIALRKGSTETDVVNLMNHWTTVSADRTFKDIVIHSGSKLQYALINNCLVLSPSGALLEDVIIRNQKNELLRKDESFVTVHDMQSDDIPMHFIVKQDEHNWLQLDPGLSAGTEVATLSGYTLLQTPTSNSFALTGEGNNIGIANCLPKNTSILDVYTYPDFETGWQKHNTYHENSDASKFWSQAWKDLGDSCACDINESMLSWRDGEWGNVVIAINDSATAELSFFKIKDTLDVIALMRPLLKEQSVRPDGIYQHKYPLLFERNQPAGILVNPGYVAQSNGYLFAAATPGALNQVLHHSDTLSQLSHYQLARKNTTKSTGRFCFQQEFYTSPIPRPMLNALEGFSFISTSAEKMDELKYLVQVTIPYHHDLNQTSNHTTETQPSGNNVADPGKIIRGPFTVINHNTKGKETLLQNDRNELVLKGEDGNVLWTKKLESAILGEVTQIDALKNGKLQMAFATESAIHILDRNGHELSGFPISPKPPITSPLHVADYDENKKYRLLCAVGDDLIFNLNVNGKDTEGWKYQGQFMVSWIDDFKVGGEDYIMTVSPSGQMRFLKRTGEVRHTTSVVLAEYNGEACIVQPADNIEQVKITYTSKSGETKTIAVGK